MSLWAQYLSHAGRRVHKWKYYFTAYERHFARYVNRPATMIEIGCGGGSLQMWKRYLGPHAQIVGIDISPWCADYAEDQIARPHRQPFRPTLHGDGPGLVRHARYRVGRRQPRHDGFLSHV